MQTLLGHAFVALDRETAMVAALASLVVSGVAVAAGAIVLLWRDRRRRAAP